MNMLVNQEFIEHFKEIDGIKNVEDIVSYIKRIDALKAALESVDRFHEQSVKYAKLEAYTLIRAVELGGAKRIPTKHRKTAEWLFSLSESERERYIAMCADGMTIDNIYKREVGDDLRLQQGVEVARTEEKNILDELKEIGITNVQNRFDAIRTFVPDKRLAEDMIDGVRNRMRKAGAVGVGGCTGLYVIPEKADKEAVKKAIIMRYESAMDDMENIVHIAHTAKVKLSWKDFGVDVYKAARSGHGFLVSFIVGLSYENVIEDFDDFFSATAKSDFYEEVKWAEKFMGIGKRDFIKREYEREFGTA